MVARVDAAEHPQHEAQTTVRIQTDRHMPRGVVFSGQFQAAAKGCHGGVGHLKKKSRRKMT